jgi:hypothetical protein
VVEDDVGREVLDGVRLARPGGGDDAHSAIRRELRQIAPDGEVIAHILLGSLYSELVVQLLKSGESARLADALRSLIDSLLV